MKTLWYNNWMYRCSIKEANGVLYDFIKIGGCINMLRTIKNIHRED